MHLYVIYHLYFIYIIHYNSTSYTILHKLISWLLQLYDKMYKSDMVYVKFYPLMKSSGGRNSDGLRVLVVACSNKYCNLVCVCVIYSLCLRNIIVQADMFYLFLIDLFEN